MLPCFAILKLASKRNEDWYGAVLRLPRFLKRRVQADANNARKIRGNLDFQPVTETLVCGWVAAIGDFGARTAILHIDHTTFSVHCTDYRADLERAGINAGFHAFTFAVPLEFADAQPHQVKLFDEISGKLLSEGVASWSRPRDFTDFDGFMQASLVAPLVRAPFREEDKRVFALLETVADEMVGTAMAADAKPVVSIIMPVYNRAECMTAAVESVLAQRYDAFELIIVDDASTDGSHNVAKAFCDSRITVIRLEQNRGVSAARNIGLAHAAGAFIAYLDSDNTWDERYLGVMVHALTHTGSIGVYCGQWLYRGRSDSPFAGRFGAFNKSLVENRNYIDLNAFMHTLDAGRAIGHFDESLRRFVDWDLILRLSDIGQLSSVPVFLSRYYYDNAPNTLTGNTAFSTDASRVRDKRASSLNALSPVPRLHGLQADRATLDREVTIIIPSYEALDDLQACLEALDDCPYRSDLHVMVVDNSSSFEIVEYLKQKVALGSISVIFNESNLGFTSAVNLGLSARVSGSDVLLLNNDAIVTRDAISLMQQAVVLLPETGIIAPQQVFFGGTRTMSTHVPYADPAYPCDVNLSSHHRNIVAVPMFHCGDAVELSFAPFFAVYIPQATLEGKCHLDAEFGRHYRSDHTYCSYVRHILRKKIYQVSDAVVWHRLQRSTDELTSNATKNSTYKNMIELNQWEPEALERFRYRQAEWDK